MIRQAKNELANLIFGGGVGALVGAGIADSVIVNLKTVNTSCGPIEQASMFNVCHAHAIPLTWQIAIYIIGAATGALGTVWFVSVWPR